MRSAGWLFGPANGFLQAADKIGDAVTSTTAGEIPGVGEVAGAAEATNEGEVASKVVGEAGSPVKVDRVAGLEGAVAGAGAGEIAGEVARTHEVAGNVAGLEEGAGEVAAEGPVDGAGAAADGDGAAEAADGESEGAGAGVSLGEGAGEGAGAHRDDGGRLPTWDSQAGAGRG